MKNLRRTFIGACILSVCGLAPFIGEAQTTEIVSVDSTGNQANNESSTPAISAGGRYVAFDSNASNLVIGDNNGKSDVFVHDRDTGITERVSIDSAGAEGNGISKDATISADGRYVAFSSSSSNLVPGDTNGKSDIFVHDRETGLTERVSVNSDNVQGNGNSVYPAISGNGRYVAFSSTSDNLVPEENTGEYDIFIRDRQTGITERIPASPCGINCAGNVDSSISADGRYVAFQFELGNDFARIHVYDRATATIEEIDIFSGFPEYGFLYYHEQYAFSPAISGDGRYIAFTLRAEPNDIETHARITVLMVYDRTTGTLERVYEADSWFFSQAAVSADGRYLAFESTADDLVADDTNGTFDVFVYDRAVDTIERVSVSVTDAEGNGPSTAAAISANGQYVGFSSAATNLVSGDSNGVDDIFVRDRGTAPTVGGLMALVDGFGLPQGIDTALNSLLGNIASALSADNAAKRQDAANKLSAFIALVEAQRGKRITDEQADQLIASANELLDELEANTG